MPPDPPLRSKFVNPNPGSSPDRMARILADYALLQHNASQVYSHATGGRLNRTDLTAAEINAMIDVHVGGMCVDAAESAADVEADQHRDLLGLVDRYRECGTRKEAEAVEDAILDLIFGPVAA